MSDDLVSRDDFIKATGLEKFGMGLMAGPLMKLIGIEKVNALYAKMKDLPGPEFIEAFFELMEIEVKFDPEELEHIPKTGPFITVSNHPFGLLDGMILLKLVMPQRPDFRVMVNFLLQYVGPLSASMISVNPLETHQKAYSSLKGMKEALGHLKDGHPLGIFPAGEVSTFHPQMRTVLDRGWQRPAIKLIKRAQVPIVPIYFHGANSLWFHLMGLLHPSLRTVAIPSEMMRKRQATVPVRIGAPISLKEQNAFEDPDRYGRFLRARTYALESGLEVKPFFKPRINLRPKKHQEEIAPPVSPLAIEKEIANLAPEQKITTQQNFEVYVARAPQIPQVLLELGRLREITFRAVGEGTNHRRDLDEYDLYYQHLFIWEREQKKIVGAYRLGKGDEIMDRYGKKGFYIHSLFRINDGFKPILSRSIELGRSFIVEEYQKHRLSLFLLWKGIHTVLLSNPTYQYLIGPVSISNNYSRESQTFIVNFIYRYYFDEKLARYIKPRKKFKPAFTRADVDELLESTKADVKIADKILADMEPAHFRLPVLLKKYISQNARILAFNVDPAFNNSLDGFMMLDLKELPMATMDNLK